MPDLLNSYLKYARGESGKFSPWAVLNLTGLMVRPFVRLRNALYDRGVYSSVDPPIPVISIGNLCHGGTNKTPMVEMMTRSLMKLGLEVGIVSRGYGGETKSPLWVGQGGKSSDRMVTGDEPLMLAHRLPEARVVVSRERYDGVCLLSDLGADVAVADDAFQHRRMGRDLDIVLIDATCPFGNGRLFPAGILREHLNALARADIAILTKTEQTSFDSLRALRSTLAEWLPEDRVFNAHVVVESWCEMTGGAVRYLDASQAPEGRFLAFSAIGNPESFYRSLKQKGIEVADTVSHRDHHRFSWRDIENLEAAARAVGATGFMCTEKDLHNMPPNPVFSLPLYVPRITVAVQDDESFWRTVTRRIRPNFVVASNGYGEDAIGAMLAARLRARYPSARVAAFTLVGNGKEYRDRGIEVCSPPSELPSGGVVKYSIRALLRDFKHGLRRDIGEQIAAWRAVRGQFRTPICVGDVYLLFHTLWGQGLTPVLVATAKSVQLSGHLGVERALLRRRSRMVWTRDEETATELAHSGVSAVFRGNPIMDLALEAEVAEDPWAGIPRPRVMLLPGSRPRAYEDIALLLEAVRLLEARMPCGYVMVLAPTIDKARIVAGIPYVAEADDTLIVGDARVKMYAGPLAGAARCADILIGLGGTANQVSAGLGVPVVSILEKGKLVQKKLLRDAEILVPPTPEDLAEATANILADPVKMDMMTREGIRLLGGPGAIEAVRNYAARTLGWDARCHLYELLSATWTPQDEMWANRDGEAKEADDEWRISSISNGLREKLLRQAKRIRGKKTTRDAPHR